MRSLQRGKMLSIGLLRRRNCRRSSRFFPGQCVCCQISQVSPETCSAGVTPNGETVSDRTSPARPALLSFRGQLPIAQPFCKNFHISPIERIPSAIDREGYAGTKVKKSFGPQREIPIPAFSSFPTNQHRRNQDLVGICFSPVGKRIGDLSRNRRSINLYSISRASS